MPKKIKKIKHPNHVFIQNQEGKIDIEIHPIMILNINLSVFPNPIWKTKFIGYELVVDRILRQVCKLQLIMKVDLLVNKSQSNNVCHKKVHP